MSDLPEGDPLKPRRPGAEAPTEPLPGELESDLEQVESQDVGAPGEPYPDWPTAAAQDQDEGPLGEGGQLRGPDAGAGGGF